MKNVLVAGGAGGIGSDIVRIFANNGYFIYIIDIDDNRGKALAKELGSNKCEYVHLDVTDINDMRAFVKSKKNLTLNHVITVAGRRVDGEVAKFEDIDADSIEKSIRLNLTGAIYTSQAFFPCLKQAKGDKSILMISSINGQSCYQLPIYSSAKAGLYGFCSGAVKEFAESGIRINTLSPGTIKTEATMIKEKKDFSKFLSGTALGKFATTQDVANYAYHICHTFVTVTGQDHIIDAGQIMIH